MNTKAFRLDLCSRAWLPMHAQPTRRQPRKMFLQPSRWIQVSIKMDGLIWRRPICKSSALQTQSCRRYLSGCSKGNGRPFDGLLSAVRNRGEFAGELGETFLFTPPKGSIPAKSFMVIGLGEEKDLSLDTLRLIGRIAVREPSGSRPRTLPGRRSFATKAIRPLK